jgi:hypothetical protein
LLDLTSGTRMKLQAHLPIGGIGGPHWSAAKIVFASLVGAAALVGTVESGVLHDNPLIESLRLSSAEDSQISGAHRISLGVKLLSHPGDHLRRFSVAHPLPAEVASSQRFSIGADARAGFQVFGDAAVRDLSRRPVRRPEMRGDRMMLMLMLARLRMRRY